jgi:mannose-1-phosphate guanylyltransferase
MTHTPSVPASAAPPCPAAAAGDAGPSAIGPGDPQSPFGDPFGDTLDAVFGSTGGETLDAVGTLPAEQPDPEAGLRTELSLWALVFAGGIGSRFWPLSTPERPKPLLALVGERPLIAETVSRLAPTVPPSRVLVLTSADIADALHAAIPEVPGANMLVEPRPMGTAAALAWGATEVARRAGPKSTLVAVHADLAVGYPDELRRLLARAAGLTAQGAPIVLIGAEPTRAEAGFGYVVPGDALDADEGAAEDPSAAGAATNGNGNGHAPADAPLAADDETTSSGSEEAEVSSAVLGDPRVASLSDTLVDVPLDLVAGEGAAAAGAVVEPPAPPPAPMIPVRTAPRRVARFVEKPAPLLAADLIAQGAFWHTGILVAQADAVLDALAERTPELQAGLPALAAGKFDRFAGLIQSISIERGLLERSADLVVLPGAFDWDDVGTWASLRRVRALDDTGNGVWGRAHLVDASSCVVHADGDGAVVVYGLTGALVVSRPGLTFVTTLDRAAELNPLLDALPEELRGRRAVPPAEPPAGPVA